MAVFQGKIIFGRRRILNLVFSFLFVYGMIVAFLFLNQRIFIYHPDDARQIPAAAGVAEMQVIAVHPADMDEAIEGWYKPPSDPSKPVVLYFHGNGGGIGLRVPRVVPLMREGYGVLLAEYRGYGGNPGKPTEKGLYADAAAYFSWLLKDGITEDRIVIYGESLGSGVATWLASRYWNIRGLVLDAPFTSLVDVAQGRMIFIPVFALLLDRYPSLGRMGQINVPLLVLHGDRDRVVPLSLGKKLFAAANEPKTMKIYPQGQHNDLYAHGAGADVLKFLQTDHK